MKRRVLYVIVLVVALGVGVYYLVSARGPEGGGTYRLAEVTRGDLENVISSTGTLEAVGTVDVGTQVSGTIDRIDVDFNDAIHKGQVLAVLDTAVLRIAVLDAEASLTRAQAQYDQAQAEHERNLALFEKGYVSEQEFLPIQTNVKTTRASLQSAQAALERAQANIKHAIIRSPIDGTVIQRSVEPGQTVAASFSTPTLFVIARDLSRMEIYATVDESDIGQIKEGRSARFTVEAYPDQTFHGTVRQIRLQPTTIQNVVNYTVIVDASNEGGLLLPGMTATVDFVIEQRADVLLVPNAALRFEPTQEMMAELFKRAQGRLRAMPDSVRQAAQQRRAEYSSGGREAGMPPFAPSGSQDEVARLWVLDESGEVRMVPVQKGATDGRVTEIVVGPPPPGARDRPAGGPRRIRVREGTQVIIGLAEQQEAKTETNRDTRRSMRPPFRPF